MKKSVISLISYDYELLPMSISSYYEFVDEIVLGLDKNRQTWAGNSFTIDEAKLHSALKEIDKDEKISIVEESFYQFNSDDPIKNDNYERNYLKAECSNDWVFSFDADEILLNAKDFFYKFCPLVERYKDEVDLCMTWVTPYKEIDEYTLLIAEEDNSPFFRENQGIATSKSSTFTYARWTDKSAKGQNRIQSPLIALHYSLCRNEKKLEQKINNTGHANLVKKDPFFDMWKATTLDNYHTRRNFKTSGLGNAQWPKLIKIPTRDLKNYIIEQAGI